MPEKSLADIPRPLRELFDKGNAAFQRQNWDYAVAIFGQILEKEPGFYDCREALRASQFKKTAGGSGFFKKMFGSASNSSLIPKGRLALRNDPLEAILVAEQILNSDPNNVSGHKLLADAALQADLPRTAVLSLEIALKAAPNDKELAMRLGDALIRAGQIPRAETVFAELQKAYPNDQAVSMAAKDASAKRTLSEGGYATMAAGTGSYRDALRNKEEAVTLEQENREVKSADVADRLLREYEARLVTEPDNPKLLRQVAELYTKKGAFDTALDLYRKIAQTEGVHDPAIERTITETTLRKFDHAISQVDPSSPQAAEEIARIREERQEFELSEHQRRVERYPNDLLLRFELGVMYFNAGRISEAIQEFQKAQNNPHKRIAALNYMGQSFAHRGMNDLAVRTFQNALKEKPVFDEEKKELIYHLGTVLEKMDKKEEAIEQFKQIYETDIGYRDVAAKVDAYYSSR
jgi:tetratricopeptide (TPR) repeat protein